MIQNDISIIVVDDKKSSSAMISTTLGKAAYEDIRICLNAAQALAEIRQRPADVLLADWEMPEMTGLQLTDKVRELDEDLNHYTAVILLTGNEESDAVLKAFELGVDDYVVKKEDKRELLGRVHAACRIATMQNTLLDTTHELTRTARLLMDKSTTHPLTGMPNRNAFELQLDSAIRQVATRNGTVACAIIHLLDFEKTEANLDRESADGVLVGAAKRIVRAIRPMDFIGHIGREQFAIVMHYQNSIHFKHDVFARIINSVNQRPISAAQSHFVVKAEIGMACCSSDGDIMTPQLLLKQADEKLSAYKLREVNTDASI